MANVYKVDFAVRRYGVDDLEHEGGFIRQGEASLLALGKDEGAAADLVATYVCEDRATEAEILAVVLQAGPVLSPADIRPIVISKPVQVSRPVAKEAEDPA